MVAGDEMPFTEIVIGYDPAARLANYCGTVKLIWNSPTVARPAKAAAAVMFPIVTVTPLTACANGNTPAGVGTRPVAKLNHVTRLGVAEVRPIDGSPT
jgi:hypothetical protein